MMRWILSALLLLCLALVASPKAHAACAGSLTFPLNSGTATWTGLTDPGGSNCVLGSVPMPSSSSSVGIAPTATTSAASNAVGKASAGNFYGFVGTTGSTAGCFMVFNATSLPGNGTVTPLYVVQAAANTTVGLNLSPVPAYFSTGITVGFSSTCGFTLTASTTAFISVLAQ